MAKKIKKIKVNNTNEKDIKYYVSNTPIPVVITFDDQVLFETNDEMLKDLNSGNLKVMSKHTENAEKSLEYLILEGFIEK
jgi:alpha-glucosidase (family GH31 glycosyl hydrolase)